MTLKLKKWGNSNCFNIDISCTYCIIITLQVSSINEERKKTWQKN